MTYNKPFVYRGLMWQIKHIKPLTITKDLVNIAKELDKNVQQFINNIGKD